MTNLHLSALAVEAIEFAEIETGIARKAIFRPNTLLERKARLVALAHMRGNGAAVCEVARAFGVADKTVRGAMTKP